MLTREEIDLNRKIAVETLRLNPAGHKQIKGTLTDRDNGYCAIGEIAEALHVSPVLDANYDVYNKINRMLDLDRSSTVYDLNDSGYSFKAIADKLAKMWKIN